eukprot:g658.t1
MLLYRYFAGTKETPSTSFIQRAKAAGANALLGTFLTNSGRFDSCLKGMDVEKIESGSVTCSLEVEKHLENAFGTLHGGAISTIVDVVGTLALLSVDPTKPGVSVDLNVSFVSAAKAGERVSIEGVCLKVGRKLGFSEVTVVSETDGRTIAKGRHTKAFR